MPTSLDNTITNDISQSVMVSPNQSTILQKNQKILIQDNNSRLVKADHNLASKHVKSNRPSKEIKIEQIEAFNKDQ